MFSKKTYKICSILVLCIMLMGVSLVYADEPKNPGTGGAAVPEVETAASNVWATAEKIVQILSVAAIVFAGLRYMFTSSSGKADIKKETAILILGAVFVFGAVHIAKFVYSVTNSIFIDI